MNQINFSMTIASAENVLILKFNQIIILEIDPNKVQKLRCYETKKFAWNIQLKINDKK